MISVGIALTSLADEMEGDWKLVRMTGDPIIDVTGETASFRRDGDSMALLNFKYQVQHVWPMPFRAKDGRSFKDSQHRVCLFNVALVEKPTDGIVCTPEDVKNATRDKEEAAAAAAETTEQKKKKAAGVASWSTQHDLSQAPRPSARGAAVPVPTTAPAPAPSAMTAALSRASHINGVPIGKPLLPGV